MKIIKILLLSITVCSLALNVYLAIQLDRVHINPRVGKDCSVEMRSIVGDEWHPVILIHGYWDNYSVAKYLVDLTENDETARGGRPKGSFRVKAH